VYILSIRRDRENKHDCNKKRISSFSSPLSVCTGVAFKLRVGDELLAVNAVAVPTDDFAAAVRLLK